MTPRNRTIFRTIFIILLSLGVILLAGGFFLSRYLEKKLATELKSVNITYSSFDINPLRGSATVNDLRWIHVDDSLSRAPHELILKHLRLSGFNVYQFIRTRKVQIQKIMLVDGYIHYNRNLKIKKNQKQSGVNKIDLGGISVDIISLSNINVNILNDSLTEYSGTIDLSLRNVGIDDIKQAADPAAYTTKAIEVIVTRLTIQEKDAMYRTRISRISANSNESKILIDSLVVLPLYSKYRFSRIGGRQVDRLVTAIPKIAISGFIFKTIKDSLFTATMVEITSANLLVFRDKRLPFIKETKTPLPIAFIRSLNFGMAIDTLKITDAKITYEEFPEKGFQTGQIYFEKLNATMDHLSNRDYYPNYKQATLNVTSRVMGKGTIRAEFSLPYEKAQVYNAKGRISGLALHHLNPILESLAFISIQSGVLNQLDFNFDYNDLKSTGSVLVNYENLTVKSLTKDKEAEKNEGKTLLINLLLKNNKDKRMSREKRTGTIYFERDQRKAIFNVWVKSLFSGLKSSVLESPNQQDKEKTKRK